MSLTGHSTVRTGPAQPVQSVDRALDLLAAVAASEQAPTVAEPQVEPPSVEVASVIPYLRCDGS